ncbi:MAG TPA: MBOAT family protein, partial [Vicinamibacteria bacterium]
MLFNSLPFLYLFLPVTYAVFWRLRTKRARHVWLTLTGYAFYSMWDFRFCGLMLVSTLISYGAGLGFLKARGPGARKALLLIPIAADLALLGFFKYADFLLGFGNAVSGWLGSPARFPLLNVILPVGISFYTFHTITYIVDCYRGKVVPTRSFFEFSCFVSLFTQLVAGPIVRFSQIEKDLGSIDTAGRREGLESGWSFFAIGLFKKVLVADTIAMIIDPALADPASLSTAGMWLCALGYTYQLYFDFSGYSDMAVGLGRLFGLRIPQNFNSPYRAADVADFWRRWHISLSTCLRDYLDIPLGGSRGGALRTGVNLMVTMLLGGLWHGANWTFVLWGGYHGLLLCLNRAVADRLDKVPFRVRSAVTFLLVLLGWVVFRAADVPTAFLMLRKMFVWESAPLFAGWAILL